MNNILSKQIALDYCCTVSDVIDGINHFTEYSFSEGRRVFQERSDCFLKIAVINGKLLFTGNKDIIVWCRKKYSDYGAEWFMEAKNMHILNNRLYQSGYRIETMHPYYISETISEVCTDDYEIHWYFNDEIEQFRGDKRFNEAFAFCPKAPDVIGVSAIISGEIIGMAGASMDSDNMWQIGINTDRNYRKAGIGKMLVALLKNHLLSKGILPYYGTSVSHLASQRLAIGTGFLPEWVELYTEKIEK